MGETLSMAELQLGFVSEILPRVELHGRIYFRHKRPDQREELIAEMVGLCWKWFIRLHEQGKDATQFPSALAGFAARAVNSGRRVCGQERAKDCLSGYAQRCHGFCVQSLPQYDTGTEDNDTLDALRDNTQTPPPDQAAFRHDFPLWLGRMPERNERIARDMAMGEYTQDLAEKYRISAARVSQLRRQFFEDWTFFCET